MMHARACVRAPVWLCLPRMLVVLYESALSVFMTCVVCPCCESVYGCMCIKKRANRGCVCLCGFKIIGLRNL